MIDSVVKVLLLLHTKQVILEKLFQANLLIVMKKNNPPQKKTKIRKNLG